MENLLALPVSPLEMMFGKVLPYIGMGAVQVLIVLGVARGVRGADARLLPALLSAMVACSSPAWPRWAT
jgi:ABC-type Na+ efflux pump permease subunit